VNPALKISVFHDTFHAKQRSGERAISLEAMKDVVKYPTQREQQWRGPNGGFVYKFTKRTGRDTLVVVAEVKKSECWLITAFKL
jgi:hypothetical protein